MQITQVLWNKEGNMVAVCTSDTIYTLRYDAEKVHTAMMSEEEEINEEDGIAGAFEMSSEVKERLTSGQWVGDCLVYVSGNNRLNYTVGGQIMTVAHLDRKLLMLGYLSKFGLAILLDIKQRVVTYAVNQAVLRYQTLVLRGEEVSASM